MSNRRKFLKDIAAVGAGAFAAQALMGCSSSTSDKEKARIAAAADEANWLVPKNEGLKITGTFLDEISHDIPHQNWGMKEWDQDFQHMKAIGIDTVIMIRSGYR